MRAIINSQYVIEDIENFSLCMNNIFIGFKSQKAKEQALEQLKDFKFNSYSSREVQFPAGSGLNTISIFEDYDSKRT